MWGQPKGYAEALASRGLGQHGRRGGVAKGKRYAKQPTKGGGKKRKLDKVQAAQKQVNKQLKTLKRRVESGMGTYVYKLRGTTRLIAAVNLQNMATVQGSTTGTVEAAIDNLPVFNPALPGTYTFVNFTSGTQQKEVEIAATYSYCIAKNNYNAPARVTMFVCIPRSDTSLSPTTAVSGGLTDEGSGLGITTPLIGPRDSEQFRDLWIVKAQKSSVLVAGQTMKMSYRAGAFQYDPSFVDSHAFDYQPRYHGHAYLIKVEGVLGHDQSAAEIGYVGAGIDISRVINYVVKYEAGADIHYIEVDDQANSFTNGGVVSSYSDVVKETYTVN